MTLFGKVAFAHRRTNNLRHPEKGRTESRGLSGEHIQLCAEGARQTQGLPNLSGKRTENLQIPWGKFCEAVLVIGLLIFIERRT